MVVFCVCLSPTLAPSQTSDCLFLNHRRASLLPNLDRRLLPSGHCAFRIRASKNPLPSVFPPSSSSSLSFSPQPLPIVSLLPFVFFSLSIISIDARAAFAAHSVSFKLLRGHIVYSHNRALALVLFPNPCPPVWRFDCLDPRHHAFVGYLPLVLLSTISKLMTSSL